MAHVPSRVITNDLDILIFGFPLDHELHVISVCLPPCPLLPKMAPVASPHNGPQGQSTPDLHAIVPCHTE